MRDAGDLAQAQLESRLSRSGVKETTLDYTREFTEHQFAERRGFAEQIGVRSEIDIPVGLERENLSLSRRSVPASLGLGGLGEGRDQARDAERRQNAVPG